MKQMKWIDRMKKKPPTGIPILAYNGWIRQAIFFDNELMKHGYFLEDTAEQFPLYYVTHWAEMPELPKTTI